MVSLSARRAWIEIKPAEQTQTLKVSLSARRAWIEIIDYIIGYVNDAMSLSARRAWIEMVCCKFVGLSCFVALRKESVDRNGRITSVLSGLKLSLSARRAWIEI